MVSPTDTERGSGTGFWLLMTHRFSLSFSCPGLTWETYPEPYPREPNSGLLRFQTLESRSLKLEDPLTWSPLELWWECQPFSGWEISVRRGKDKKKWGGGELAGNEPWLHKALLSCILTWVSVHSKLPFYDKAHQKEVLSIRVQSKGRNHSGYFNKEDEIQRNVNNKRCLAILFF